MSKAPKHNKAIYAGNFSINITGINELDDKFKEMPGTLKKKALRSATRAVAKLTLQDAKARTPRKTGALQKSLTVRATKINRKNSKTMVGASVQTREGMFKGDQFYGGFLELGTDERWTTSRTMTERFYRGKIQEHKFWFLRPALEAFPEKKLEMFRQSVTQWMQEQADKQIAKIQAKTK